MQYPVDPRFDFTLLVAWEGLLNGEFVREWDGDLLLSDCIFLI